MEKTLNSCSEAIKLDENNVDALCDRAEGYILNEMYDEGLLHFIVHNIIVYLNNVMFSAVQMFDLCLIELHSNKWPSLGWTCV